MDAFCSACGQQATPGAAFCSRCGRRTPTSERADSPPDIKPPDPAHELARAFMQASPRTRRIIAFLVVAVPVVIYLAPRDQRTRATPGENEENGSLGVFAKRCQDSLRAQGGQVPCTVDPSRRLLAITGPSINRETALKFMDVQRAPAEEAGFARITFWNGKSGTGVYTQDFYLDPEGHRAKAKFDSMTPEQHLAVAQKATEPGATVDQFDEGLRHLKAIPNTSSVAIKAKALQQRLPGLKLKRQQEIARADANFERRQAQAKRVLRDNLAKEIENGMLSEGYDVHVNATGSDHTVLYLKWVLASRPLVYQLSQKGEFFETARNLGFKRIEITDGYEQTWHWDLL
jgi:hypothetical protein